MEGNALPALRGLASVVSDSSNLAERYAPVKCARRAVPSLAQPIDFSWEAARDTHSGQGDEVRLSAGATG